MKVVSGRRWEDWAEKIPVAKQQLGMLVSLGTGGLAERHSGRNVANGRRPCAAALVECSTMPSLTLSMWDRQNPAVSSLILESEQLSADPGVKGQTRTVT